MRANVSKILTFSFGFLGLSVVGLSQFARDLQTKENLIAVFTVETLEHAISLLVFLIYLFRYLLGNLSYLYTFIEDEHVDSVRNFFALWGFVLFQFILVVLMGFLVTHPEGFIFSFVSLIGSELLWSFFNIPEDQRLFENLSRILMLLIVTFAIVSLVGYERGKHVLLILVFLDCINDYFKNKDNYGKILKND